MVHRAIMRAVPGLFAPGQLEVGGHDNLGYYIQILPYENLMERKKYLGYRHYVDPEEQNTKLRTELSEAPLWNREINPKGVFIRFGNPFKNGTSPALNREDINQRLLFWDNGYTVTSFSFEFEVETRDEWSQHQMDLFDWFNWTGGIDTGQELINMVDEAQLAEHLGEMEAERLPEMALAV